MSAKSSWNDSSEYLKHRLKRHLRFKLDLVINENRTIMLNMLGRRRLSIHKMFVDAPEEVIAAVASYVKGRERDQTKKLIRSYIQSNLQDLDYSHRISKKKLVTKGEVYDLEQIYETHNAAYFKGELELSVTWFGRQQRQRRKRVIFGEYHDSLKLIKIHRMLDDTFFPPYFVSFVVYHEMLHHIIPGYRDERGFFRVHTREFKQRERLYHDYARARAWEKRNKEKIFGWA